MTEKNRPDPQEPTQGPAEESDLLHPDAEPTPVEDAHAQDLLLGEDEREYPAELLEDHGTEQTTDHTGAPITVAPSEHGRGYQTVTVNQHRAPDEAKAAARRRRVRRRTLTLVGALAVFVVMIFAFSMAVRALLPAPEAEDYPAPGGDPVTFTVEEGQGALAIGDELVAEDIVASQDLFVDAYNASESTTDIQPGEYELRRQMPAADAVSILRREGQEAVNYVAVNRGMRQSEVFEALAESTGRPVSDFESAAEDPTAYGLPEQAPSLEGYLATGEYRFPVTAEPQAILEQLIAPTFEEFERLGISEEDEQYRVLTIASIVEAEALPKDYAMVAGIIENRLQPNDETNGYLQVDATVIYGMGTRQVQFTEEDRANEDNAYNSYVHAGLPPGPIGSPSTDALDAAAEPEESDFLYWITTNLETGETQFSETYAQHQEYWHQYRDYCAQNAEICGEAGTRAGDGATGEPTE